MRSLSNHLGFSIVELMVVVAIVGILSTVAAPKFDRIISKACQSEAKSLLSYIYAAEKGFHAEFEAYYSNLKAIGFDVTGSPQYNIIIDASASDALHSAYANQLVSSLRTHTSFNRLDLICDSTSECNSQFLVTSYSSATWKTTANEFKIGAVRLDKLVGEYSLHDIWTIDQNRQLKNSLQYHFPIKI